IEIDGDRATGVWYFLGPFTFYKNNADRWLVLRYDDDYVKINGEWKYQHLRATVRLNDER
ncbi:MAG: nuclear transport factor 2 family protein, partial [Porticoccaceae bacterium]